MSPALFPFGLLDDPFHAGGALLPHAFGYMPVGVEGEGGGVVAQVILHRLYIIPAAQGGVCPERGNAAQDSRCLPRCA